MNPTYKDSDMERIVTELLLRGIAFKYYQRKDGNEWLPTLKAYTKATLQSRNMKALVNEPGDAFAMLNIANKPEWAQDVKDKHLSEIDIITEYRFDENFCFCQEQKMDWDIEAITKKAYDNVGKK